VGKTQGFGPAGEREKRRGTCPDSPFCRRIVQLWYGMSTHHPPERIKGLEVLEKKKKWVKGRSRPYQGGIAVNKG